MSTDPTVVEKVTTDKTEKIKNPKRVEAGKKLAAISKAAKEKKMRDMIKMEKSLSDSSRKNGILYVTVIIAFTLFLLYLIFTAFFRSNKTLPEEKEKTENNTVKRNVLENL